MGTASNSGLIDIQNKLLGFDASGNPAGISPTAPLQVAGNDGSGNLAAATLVAGAGMELSQSGSNIQLSSTSGSTSGSVGIGSPPNVSYGEIQSPVTITAQYSADDPQYQNTTPICTVGITPDYTYDSSIGSQLQGEAFVTFAVPNGTPIGLQLAIYQDPTATSLPISPSPAWEDGPTTSSLDNSGGLTVKFLIPTAAAGVLTNFVLCGVSTVAPSIVVDAYSFFFSVQEVIPNTQSVVSSQLIEIGSSTPITVGTVDTVQPLPSATTILSSQTYTKQYENSLLALCGGAGGQGSQPNAQWFGHIYLYMPLASAAPTTSIADFTLSGSGASSVFTQGIRAATDIELILNDPTTSSIQLGAGKYALSIGAAYQGIPWVQKGVWSNLIITEILPLASAGLLQSYSLASISSITGIPYSATINPTYSAVSAIGTLSVDPRSASSNLIYTGEIRLKALPSDPECAVGYFFYSSNDPTALPFTYRKLSQPANTGGVYNDGQLPFAFKMPSSGAFVPEIIYVGVASLNASQLSPATYISVNFEEEDVNPTTSSSTGGSASVGVGSPCTVAKATLSSDLTITTAANVNVAPSTSGMQLVASTTITPKFTSTNGVGSQVAIIAVVPFYDIAANPIGMQAAIFVSGISGAPTYSFKENGKMTGSVTNEECIELTATIDSQGALVPITISVYAAYLQVATNKISASRFALRAYEVVPNSEGIINSTEVDFAVSNPAISTVWSSKNATLSQTTQIAPTTTIKKLATNSLMSISGAASYRNYGGGATDYYCGTFLYFSTPANINSSPEVLYSDAGYFGSATMANTSGGFCQAPLDIVLPASLVGGAGNYNVAVGATVQGGVAPNSLGVCSRLVINETLPLSSSGNLQNFPLPSASATASTVITTLSPQYSQTNQLTNSGPVFPRAATSVIAFSGTCTALPSAGGGEAQVLVSFYTSTLATGTPFQICIPSCSNSPSSTNNHSKSTPFYFEVPSGGINVPIQIYATVASLTSGVTTTMAAIAWDASEIFTGNIASGVTTVSSTPSSYLNAAISGTNLNVSNTLATSSQAGILSLANPFPVNTLLRVTSAGQLVAATLPYFPPFGSAVWLNLGGAHAGQVQGTQSGTAVYITAAPIPAAANEAGQILFPVSVEISLNITTVGTSTGALTVVGMPATPFLLASAVPVYVTLENDRGFALPNNTVLQVGYTSGSTTLTLYQYNIDTQVRTAATLANTPLTAPVQFRFKTTIMTLTAPTN